jgi:hypothetical protein
MNTTEASKPRTLLFNPSVYVAGGEALIIGVVAILVAGLIGAVSNTHFDGVLDTHTGVHAPLWVFLVEGFINWLSLALVLLVVGRIVSKTPFRTIDLLGTQAMARWPTVLTSLLFLPPAVQRYPTHILQQLSTMDMSKPHQMPPIDFGPASEAIVFFAAMLALIPVMIWLVMLMYRSFSVSCNLKGAKGIRSFVIGLLVAEAISKVVIIAIIKANGIV